MYSLSPKRSEHPVLIEPGNAICYSGYRDGQSPVEGLFPSYDQVRQDLHLLARNWRYLRLYDCSRWRKMTD